MSKEYETVLAELNQVIQDLQTTSQKAQRAALEFAKSFSDYDPTPVHEKGDV